MLSQGFNIWFSNTLKPLPSGRNVPRTPAAFSCASKYPLEITSTDESLPSSLYFS